jgi:polyhydroxyalkanoate synthesis regulator phasin
MFVVEDSIRKMVDLTVGFMSLSREKVVETAKQWAEERKFTPAQTREFIQSLLERGEQERTGLQQNMQEQVGKTLERMGVRDHTQSIHTELASLKALVLELGTRINQLETNLVGIQRDHDEEQVNHEAEDAR